MAMDALAAARAAGPVAREHAGASETARRLAPAVVEELGRAGLLGMSVPEVYGGPEVPPGEQLRALEELASHDGAAGWCAAISTTTSSLSWFMDPAMAAEVFGTPGQAYGGAAAPTGSAVAVEGGWRCDGRWAWGSGTQHAAWISGGCRTDGGEVHHMFFAPEDVEFLDTWDPIGLRGTGSTDYEVAGTFVPAGRSVRPGVDRRAVDCTLARFPNWGFLATACAAVTVGIATRAVDELVDLAAGKATPTRTPLAETVPLQLALADAEAAVGAARAFLHAEVDRTWETVSAGGRVDTAQRARLGLVAAHAARQSVVAVDLCHLAAGGSAVGMGTVLGRCLRDVHTASQHAMLVRDRSFVTYGRVRAGLPTDNPAQ